MSNNHDLAELQAQWASVRGKIRRKIGDPLFKSWFKPLTLLSYESNILILGVPNKFIRTRLIEEYLDLIKITWKQQNKQIKSVEIVLIRDESFKVTVQDKIPKQIVNKQKSVITPTISAELDLSLIHI